MIIMQKITKQNLNESLHGVHTVLAYSNNSDYLAAIAPGEIGLIAFTFENRWRILWQGGAKGRKYKKCRDLFESELARGEVSFYYIEIKP